MNNFPERVSKIKIHAFGKHSGDLTQPGPYIYQYSHDNPVSLTMNFRHEAYSFGQLHPIFSQNLPEGFVRRYISEKLVRYAHVNDMYLLALQFDKGIGHLSYNSEIPQAKADQISLGDILHWRGTQSLFEQLLERYYLNGFVAGVQPKVLVSAINKERACVTQEDYIVKTFDEEFPLLTLNEFVCMEAARSCGLEPAKCWLSDDFKHFVTERFDRYQGGRLGIEDLTVLMGKSSAEKYQSSYEMVLKATRLYTKSDSQVERVYRYIVFNCLIGNGDAHLKNFSLQYQPDRTSIELTPPYDITHTLIYETIDKKMALKLHGHKLFPDKHQLMKLAKSYQIDKPEEIIDFFADTIRDFVMENPLVKELKGLDKSILNALHHGTSARYSSKPYTHDKKKKYP